MNARKTGRRRPPRGAVLTVERSLLSKRDPLRKARYAGDAPTTVRRETGSAVKAGATASCRDARNHLGLNQRDFAQLLGKNDSTVETWESPNPKRRVDPPAFMQQLFAAFMHAQAPNGWQLRHAIKVDGPVRAMYTLLRSAFDGPRYTSALREEKTIAHHEARRDSQDRNRELVQRELAAAEEWKKNDPEGWVKVDAATVVYKR